MKQQLTICILFILVDITLLILKTLFLELKK